MKGAVEFQADYLENLAKDMWSFLENNRTERFKIHFETLFFILKYAKDGSLDISNIIDIIYKNEIEFYYFGLINKEELYEFLDKNGYAAKMERGVLNKDFVEKNNYGTVFVLQSKMLFQANGAQLLKMCSRR